jgi:hypothetical protein
MGEMTTSYPSYLPGATFLWEQMAARGPLYAGFYIASLSTKLPTSAGEVTSRMATWTHLKNDLEPVGGSGFVIDCEPYNYVNGGDNPTENPWCTNGPLSNSSSIMTSYGQQLGALCASFGAGRIIVYCSSNASWPGSYNDLVRTQNGGPNSYATNNFQYFMQGLLDGGADVNFVDASFHWGPQLSGYTWETGVAKTVELASTKFPGIKVSAMPWPDNDEGYGFYSGSEVYQGVDAGTRLGTGICAIYQHNLATGSQNAYWTGTALPQIKNAMEA